MRVAGSSQATRSVDEQLFGRSTSILGWRVRGQADRAQDPARGRCRRRAGTYDVLAPAHEDTRAARYLDHFEAGVVEQALGRVRYTIHPRTVVFMHQGSLSVPVDKEFRSLVEAREHFGVANARAANVRRVHDAVAGLAATGRSNQEIARALGISVRTVQRKLRGRQ